ncbi:MAG: sporulation related protein [Betaproteobacteria bacterium]|nr:sporulation related protein [Betaproteobacteria bacterium]
MMRRLLAAVFLVLVAAPACAASGSVLTVESVLSPAWVERANGRREPLAAGMALASKEKVHTGDGGRALLRLAEGSAVKLGESAMLGVDDLAHKDDAKGGVVAATLDVVRGAFRFTTGLLSKSSSQRDVRVKVNAITAGIRGTDVWGKSAGDRDIVCLLEGRITVSHGAAQFSMQDPNSFYIAPRAGPAQPPSPVSAAQVKEWSDETEIFARTGAVRAGGTFAVVVGSGDERAAIALRDKLRDSGFPAISVGTGEASEVRIEALSDGTEAAALAERLRQIGFAQAQPQAR